MSMSFSNFGARRIGWAAAFWTAMAAVAGAQAINHPAGFTGQTDLTFNGNATVTGTGTAQLTPAANNQTGSFFSTVKLPINNFTTRFTFHELGVVGGMADGLGFCIQNNANTTTGGGGGGMGYAGIASSIFVKFDSYPNVSTTRLLTGGAAPDDTNSLDMRAAGVDVHSQHDFRVDMNYNGTVLAMTVTDLTTNAVFSTNFTVDIVTAVGGASAFVGFTGATGGANSNQEVLNWTYANLPAPTNLMATNGINQVSLSWTASAGAASYNVLRGTTAGGPYTTIATGVAGTTYVDNTATNPNTYFYVVVAVSGALTSSNSNEVVGVPLPAPVTALPNTGLQTNENGAQAQFTIQFNQAAPGAGSLVTVSSNDITEGTVSTAFAGGTVTPTATGFTVQVAAGTSPSIVVTVTGIDDVQVDGNIPYTVSVTATNMGVVIPDVQLVNNDNDVAGITFSRTAGIVTTEDGGSDTFAVVLNRQPFGTVMMTLSTSNPLEGTVSPTTLTFTSAPGAPNGWNFPHVVTVTGVDDTVLDFTQPYTIITNPLTFTDMRDQNAFAAAGATNPPDVSCVNLDNEQIPALDHVWGGSGSGGGCGLTGLEVVLLLGAGAASRRRRRRNS